MNKVLLFVVGILAALLISGFLWAKGKDARVDALEARADTLRTRITVDSASLANALGAQDVADSVDRLDSLARAGHLLEELGIRREANRRIAALNAQLGALLQDTAATLFAAHLAEDSVVAETHVAEGRIKDETILRLRDRLVLRDTTIARALNKIVDQSILIGILEEEVSVLKEEPPSFLGLFRLKIVCKPGAGVMYDAINGNLAAGPGFFCTVG